MNRHRRALAVALILAGGGTAARAQESCADPIMIRIAPSGAPGILDPEDYTAGRDLLLSFDGAWKRRDLDALVEPMSPGFGCELYGQVSLADLRGAFATMLRDLPGTTCRTEILRVASDGCLMQAFVRRSFARLGTDGSTSDVAAEELCILVYLRKELGAMRIVGLEEFDPEGLRALRPAPGDEDLRYVREESALSLPVPSGMFPVPLPPAGFCLERLRLRGDDLRTVADVLLVHTCSPIDLAVAIDHDMEAWLAETPGARVLSTADATVAGFPARIAEARFEGGDCTLSGSGGADHGAYRLTRVYVRLDERYLLAVDLRHPEAGHAARRALLDAALHAIDVDVPAGQSFGAVVCERRGVGPIASGCFVHSASGFVLEAPPGCSLESEPTTALFSLRLAPRTSSARVRVDGVKLLEPDARLDDLIRVDGAFFAEHARYGGASSSEESRRAMAGATVVERQAGASPGSIARGTRRAETVAYLRRGAFLVTVRAAGTVDQVAEAAPWIDATVRAITFTAPDPEPPEAR